MKVIIQLLIICILQFIVVNSKDLYSITSTLIVNPNIQNNYIIGDECGNTETTSCNSLSDAVAYFNTFAQVQQPIGEQYIYQQLNLLLADGVYGVNESSIELFQFNITISPLVQNSDQVIFDGQVNVTYSPMISITAPIGQLISNQISTLSISGITFKNFVKPVLYVASFSSSTNVTINNCTFDNFISSLKTIPSDCEPMIHIDQLPANVNSLLRITNSNIQNSMNPVRSTTNSDLIYSVNAIVEIFNLEASSLSGFNSLVNSGFNSTVFIDSSSFHSINTTQGLLQISMGSNLTLTNSTFNSCVTTFGGGVIYVTSSLEIASTFNVTGCKMTNCFSKTGAGVIYALSYLSDYPTSYITNSIMNYNNGSIGGAVYVSNFPIEIDNCNLSLNEALWGSQLMITNSSLIIKNSNIYASHSEYSNVYGGTITANLNSNVTIDQCNFGKNYTSVWCNKSLVKITNPIGLKPFYICTSCNELSVDQEQVCLLSSTTSPYYSDSSIATPNNQLSIKMISILISFISLFLIL